MDVPDAPFVRTLGQGGRTALALHCTLAHSGAWVGLATAMRDQVTLIAPDMPSHGRSRDWDGQGDVFDLITAQFTALLNEPMDVIGHSFGAVVALSLATRHPDLIRTLTLIEPVFFAIAAADAPELMAQHDADARPYIEALERADVTLAARLFNRMWSVGDSPRWPDLSDRTRAAMSRGMAIVPAVDKVLFKDHKGMLTPGVFERVTMPVLILHGSLTHPVIPAICQGLGRRLPKAHVATIAGAGHMLPISHPVLAAEKIRNVWVTRPPSSV